MITRDLRYAARSLARSPRFTAIAVATLALGIGANTAVFSVARDALWKPLPFRSPDRLVWIWPRRADRDRAFFSIPNFLDSRAATPALSEMAALTPWNANLSGPDETERVSGVRVTGNVFSTLGARAAAGRLLGWADAELQASPSVVWAPAARLVGGLLYAAGPRNYVAAGAAALLLVAIAALSTLLPARRASRLTPMTVLQSE